MRKSKRGSKKSRRFQSQKLMNRMKKSKASQRSNQSVINPEKIGDTPIWSPGDGEHTIAVIPYFAGPNDPTVKEGEETYLFPYAVHRGVGATEQLVVCPATTYGKKCPICEHRMKLREEGADKEVWKKLFPRDRAIYNIVCYDHPKEERKGVQIWDVSQFYFEQPVLKIATRKKGVVFQDPENGKNIVFEIEPAKSKEDFPSYVGFAFEDRDSEIDDDILDSAVQLDQVVNIMSYKEIKELYWGGDLEGKDDDEEEEDESEEAEDLETDEIVEEINGCEDLDELEEIAEEYNFDIEGIKPYKFRSVKREMIKMASAMSEDEEEEPEEEEEEENEISWGEILKMSKVKLKKLIKSEDLDIDPAEAEDLEELREMVADELDIAY